MSEINRDVNSLLIENMRSRQAELVCEDPLRATGYGECAAAVEAMDAARKNLRRVERQVKLSARARLENEKKHGRFGLVERLLKSPVQSLAEAESTRQGRTQLMEIWSGLGKTLLEKAGWNEDEYHLACILLGTPNLKLRTSRARLELDRAIREDGDRKYEKMDGITQKILLTFVTHMSKELEREFREVNQDYYIAIMNMFQGSYNEYARDVAMNMGEELKFLMEWRNRPPVGRFYWTSTRKFLFKQIMKYRVMNKKGVEAEKKRPAPLQLSIDEMKRVEHARKAVSQSMAQYQKAISTAKTLGLLDAKPKSAKQEKDLKVKVDAASVVGQVNQSQPIIVSRVDEDDAGE